MPFRSALAAVFALLLIGPAAADAQSAQPVAHTPAPVLSAAAQQLLELVRLRVDDGAVELSSTLIGEHPDDAALHALHAISLSGYGGWKEALQQSDEYVARWPGNPWVQIARGYSVRDGSRTEEALAAAARARQLAPENADIARYVMSIYSAHNRWEQAVALADSFITTGRATAELRLEKVSALWSMAELPGIRDTAAATLAQQELERALAETPPSAAAYLAAGQRFQRDRRHADALPLLERAAELSPHSNPIRRAYWRGISARTDISAEEKQAMIHADMDAYLDARQHGAGALSEVARYLRSPGGDPGRRLDAIEDVIQREHAGTRHAASVAMVRAQRVADSAWEQATTYADSMTINQRFRDTLWTITTMPGATSIVLGDVYGRIFRLLEADSTTSGDELLFVFGRMEDHISHAFSRYHLSDRHVLLPAALAERGSHLDHAEQLARAGLEPLEDNLDWWRKHFTVADNADHLDQVQSDYHATIGWVLFHKGEIAEAKRELEKAHEALNTAPTPLYRLGRIAEAEGDTEAAERWYATGRGREDWDRSSSAALERLYLARNESLDGFDAYLAAIDERDLARRRAKAESERIAEPEPLPDFEHEWMNGGTFSSESLRGKVAVINFWGVWCGPCVREAPEIQAFAEKFRDHPDVVFITVANDIDPETTRDFVKEKGFDFPVILDAGLVRMTNIPAFPTTLFVDREGRIVFSYVGASLRLVEDYTHRIELILGRPVTEVAGGEYRPADLESAVARVRSLYFGRDFHHGAAEGEAALERWPQSSELVAWTLANLTRASDPGADAALARAESLVESRPDDVWGAIALAHALTFHGVRRGESLEASLRPIELAPTLPEAVWVRGVALHYRRQYQEVATLIEEKWPVVDRRWPELLNLQGNAYLAKGPETVAEGLKIMARVREHDPENVNAHYLAGNALYRRDRQRMDEGAVLLERAAALSPGSVHIARDRWYSISQQPGLDSEAKKARISASASELLARRGHYPDAVAVVALALSSLGDQSGLEALEAEGAALEDRVLTEFAGTEAAERVLSSRWRTLAWRLYGGEAEDTAAARTELSAMLWSFIDRPRHHNAWILGDAYMRLFDHERRDETVSPDTLLLLARGAAEHTPWLPYDRLASGLAERGVHLDVARQFARDGVDAAEVYFSRFAYDTPGDAADALDRMLSDAYAAIGYVELTAGDLVAAREAIDRALELKPDNPEVQLRAGALAEAEGDLETAEIHYAWGERYERLWPGDKSNRDALQRLYADRHGSTESYEEFIAGIEERDRARRWQRVADSRIEEPRDLPAIDLEWLDGGRIGADELEGRIVVINFWGLWCPPCVAEAPQIQQLHEKYRDDPGVVFLTINTLDLDLDEVRAWMAENEYDYPVLVDDNFAARYDLRGYPTTWFADANGRMVFDYYGYSAAVYEEFVWRVEILQAEAAAEAEKEAAAPSTTSMVAGRPYG